MTETPQSRKTPLFARHEAAGASFTDFGGWSMPVRYASDVAEHTAVRTTGGIFDISHMAEFEVTGPGAGMFLDALLASRLSTIAVGRAKYTVMLSEAGGIVDDLIVYRLADERFLIVANAGNHDAVADALAARADDDVTIRDTSDDVALIALQGPATIAALRNVEGLDLADGDGEWTTDDLRPYRWRGARFRGEDVLIARTGYTGEDGFELFAPVPQSLELWDAVVTAGAPVGIIPAGLAARDTLRLEAGMPLYGHELSLDTTPAQAGIAGLLGQRDDDYVGKAAATALDADLTRPVLVGLTLDGKRAGRAGYPVVTESGRQVGVVTSGALSPTLGHPVAMAYVDPAVAHSTDALCIDVRGTHLPATRTTLPFYRRTK